MTAKQLVSTVKQHLLSQGCKSIDEGFKGKCLYRGPRNTKCAIGCLIPDDLYSIKMEGMGACDLLSSYPQLIPLIKPEDMDLGKACELLVDLQQIHDYISVNNWPDEFANLEMEYGL
jgi:hypothetical protein